MTKPDLSQLTSEQPLVLASELLARVAEQDQTIVSKDQTIQRQDQSIKYKEQVNQKLTYEG